MQINRITDTKLSLLGNMLEYAESNYGRVPDYIFNQMCEELGLDADEQLMTVYEAVDNEWSRGSDYFWTMI